MKYFAFILIICFQSFAIAQENNEMPPVLDSRVIKHELFHILQAKYYPFGATTNNEREFEAYWYSIYRFPKLKKGNDSSETRWAYRVRDFYYDMTD